MGRRNKTIIDQEVNFVEELVSTTDLRGVITYVNDAFSKVAGYEKEEMIGKNHNLVRHPDMPAEAFKDLWEKLKQGLPWRGAVKNRCKDGRYYWVDAFVTPIYESGELIGYQSVRSNLSKKDRESAEKNYRKINDGKSLIQWYSTKKVRFVTYIVFSILLLIVASKWTYISVLFPMLPFILFKPELIDNSLFFNELKNKYDSVSRYIYSGTGETSVADFQIKMLEGKIKTILGRVSDSANSLERRANNLQHVSENTSQGLERETEELHQVATAIEEMVATIDEVAQNTATTSEKVNIAHSNCSEANTAMNSTMNKVSSLADEVALSATSAIGLSEEAEKIGFIMNEIQGIADQTNLLALNAAIEAARAGEHGRGFSVVADEVRALSSRTHQATEQIKSSIDGMQKTLNQWSTTMQKGKESAESCVSEAQIAHETVTSVYESISEISDLAIQISTASEEQSMVSQEISQNITNINDVSKNNLDYAQDVNKESTAVKERSALLASLGATFSTS